MRHDLCEACRTLADQCECVRREAEQIARGRTDHPDDVGMMLCKMEVLKQVMAAAEKPARERCQGASK